MVATESYTNECEYSIYLFDNIDTDYREYNFTSGLVPSTHAELLEQAKNILKNNGEILIRVYAIGVTMWSYNKEVLYAQGRVTHADMFQTLMTEYTRIKNEKGYVLLEFRIKVINT